MQSPRALAITLLLVSCGGAVAPPVAQVVPSRRVVHGEVRVDDYFWLRNKDSPPVLAYLRAENQYADAMMAPLRPLEDAMFREMVARLKETDRSVMVRERDFYHYSRTEAGKQYPIFCRRHVEGRAEEIILDGNAAAQGKDFFAVEVYQFSDDDRYLAYSVDSVGFRDYQLRILDIRTGALGPEDRMVTSAAWGKNDLLFYVTTDEAKRPYRLYRHVRGQDHDKDELVYEEKDGRFELHVARSRDGEYLFLEIASQTASELRFASVARPGDWTTLMPRRAEHRYRVEHNGGFFYILTNDKGRNFRLVKTRVSALTEWQELVPHSDDVALEFLDLFEDFYVLGKRENAVQRLEVTRFGQPPVEIPLPGTVYTATHHQNPEFATAVYRYQYESPIAPPSVFEYDLASRTSTLLKQEEVAGFDPNAYQVALRWAPAKDGAKIPISVVSKKGARKPAPTLLHGYGAYGYSYDVGFDTGLVSLLDRGVTVATAHIRGGGELGTRWHDAGRMMNKKNTFDDFIRAGEFLGESGVTDRKKLAVIGRSAGGLLIGATVNQRPELFAAAIADVPFVDVINTMLDESIPLTVTEFEEWGNPSERAAYDYMKSYCPYTNVAAKAYPPMLVTTAYNDSQVMYWEPAKFVARLRATKTDNNPLLFRTNMAGGHGGSSGRYDQLREDARTYAFVLGVFDGKLTR